MLGCSLVALCEQGSAAEQSWPAPQPLNYYGMTGLLDTPSARMMPDGQIAVTFAHDPVTYRGSISFEAFPWVEVALRYSRINDYFLNTPGAERPQLLDRSLSIKLHLFEETKYFPAIAVGLQDILGTGIYGGEYIVASKSFGDFDVTLGLGWGRLGSAAMFRNPLSAISKSFDERPRFDPTASQGGTPLFGSFLHGRDVSLFGGVVWQTPIDGLQAIVEYSGDAYVDETDRGIYRPDSQWNFGLNYSFDKLFDVGVSWMYGNTFGFRGSVKLDPTVESMKVLDSPPLPPSLRPLDQRPRSISREDHAPAGPPIKLSELRGIEFASADSEWSLSEYARTGNALIDSPSQGGAAGSLQDIMTSGQWYNIPAVRDQIISSLRNLGKQQRLGFEAIELKANYVSIYYDNQRYTRDTQLIHRLLRVLTTLPPSVEYFYLTSVIDGYPSTEVMLSRSAYERAVGQFSATDNLLDYVRIQPGGVAIPDEAIRVGDDYPRFDWSFFPKPQALVFDPDRPFRISVTLTLEGSVEFQDGWSIESSVTAKLFNSFSDLKPSDSVLPHVRSDGRFYDDQGEYGLQTLFVQKTGKLAPDIFYQVRAGYLEDMFGGVGGEIIWRPQGSNVSYGANLYYVKQRNFDRLFGFQDYGVVTGQASIYWQDAVWRGVNVNLHVGRYLAGDYGGTIEVTRKFDTGIEVGAFATFTDVSFEDFGEGSFDKGLIIRIPFGWIAPFNTKFEANSYLNSLKRDGGQRLYSVNPLWDDLRDSNESELRRSWALDVTPGL